MSYENQLGSLIDRELERALRFKKASDALKQSNALKDTLANRKELESIIQNGINDEKLMPFAKDSLMKYSKNNPDDHRYAKQLGFDLKSAEDLNSEKTKTRINLENSLNKISNLDPLVQTNSDSLKVMTDAVNQWQDRASELGMNQLLTTSNTRENELLANIKQQDNINQTLNTFLKFDPKTGQPNGDLDKAQLSYGDLEKARFSLRGGDLVSANASMRDALETRSTGRFRLQIGEDEDGSPLMGTRLPVNEAFEKEEKDGKWNWKMENGKRVTKSGVRVDVPGYVGIPIMEDPKKTVPEGTISEPKPAGLSEEILKSKGYYKKQHGGKERWFRMNEGDDRSADELIDTPKEQQIMSQIALQVKTQRQLAKDEKLKIEVRTDDSARKADVMSRGIYAAYETSPLNATNVVGKSKNAKKFKNNMTVDFLQDESWFKKDNMKSVGSIEEMQADLLKYMADTMENYKPSSTLKDKFDTEHDRIKGAEAVWRSDEWVAMMRNPKFNDLLNENFDFHGVEGLAGFHPYGYDKDSESQADLLQRLYKLWDEMQRQKMNLKGDALGGGGQAPGLN